VPLKQTEEKRRKVPVRKIVSGIMLLGLAVVIALMLKKPPTVAVLLGPERKAVNAQSFQQKIETLAQAQTDGSGSEVRFTAEEVRAGFSSEPESKQAPLTPESVVEGDIPRVSEPQVSFEGNLVKGQFVTELYGKKVYVTVNGHLGSKGGYATFEPTEFKVGDLEIPVSLVRDQLQKKMAEDREKLKLPEYVSEIRIENGELVVKPK
jgi:hypothetical protein